MCTVTLRRTAAIGFLLLALTARSSAAEERKRIAETEREMSSQK